MESILDQYERHCHAENRLLHSDSQANWSLDYSRLVSRAEALQRNLRHFLGEDIDPLSLRELQNLEQQIDTALKRVRSKKSQLMHESIAELQKREKKLQEQNNTLAKKVKENEKLKTSEQQNQGENSPSAPPEAVLTPGGAFHMGESENPSGPGNNAMIPPWMLRAL